MRRGTGEAGEKAGVDVLHFKDGKIASKSTYSKTTLEIAGKRVKLATE